MVGKLNYNTSTAQLWKSFAKKKISFSYCLCNAIEDKLIKSSVVSIDDGNVVQVNGERKPAIKGVFDWLDAIGYL